MYIFHLSSNLPFSKFFLPFSVFDLLCADGTVCDSDAIRTAGYNHLISRNYNENYCGLPDSAKSKTSASYWSVCPTNWSGHDQLVFQLVKIQLVTVSVSDVSVSDEFS